MVLKVNCDPTFMWTGARRGCQWNPAQMMQILVIDHVLLRQCPERVHQLWLSSGFVDCSDQSFGGRALQVRKRRATHDVDMTADVDRVGRWQTGQECLGYLTGQGRQSFCRTLCLC